MIFHMLNRLFSKKIFKSKTLRIALLGALIPASSIVAHAVTSAEQKSPELYLKTERVVENLPPLKIDARDGFGATYWTEEAVRSGDTLYGVLNRLGVSDTEIANMLEGVKMDSDLQQLRAGQTVSIRIGHDGLATDLQFFNDDDNGERHLVAIEKKDGKWQASSSMPIMETIPTLRSVVVKTSAGGAMSQAGIGVSVRQALRDIFSEQVDIDKLKKGDQIHLLYNVMYYRGQEMAAGDILGAEIVSGDKTYRAYYYDLGDAGGSYLDENGEVLKHSDTFSILPVEYTRISSPYGMRVHPILKTLRMHTGIDYAAPMGTPVVATANGTIIFKGWKGGYGHTVMVRHSNGVDTLYGHLSAFTPATGRVKAGEVIGFVGSSGRSTGPHLHYEARINDEPVNPAIVALPSPTEDSIDMAEFAKQRSSAEEKLAMVRDLSVTVAQLY